MEQIEVEPGVNLVAQVEGEGKPIVLIHGWGLNHEMWNFQIPYLTKRGYKVVAVDLRGFGNSGKPATGYDYDTWANDIGKVLEKLDLQNVTLVGYSIGGAISMYYAATRADPRIEKLALVAAAGPYVTLDVGNPLGSVPRSFFDETVNLLNNGQLADAFKLFHKIVFPGMSLPTLEWIEGMLSSASQQALVGGIEAMRDKDLRQDLPKIRVKTKIFHGFEDPFVTNLLVLEQRRLIAGATFAWFWSSGHGLFFEEVGKLNRELDW
ncbi:MAG: alpha/beta hydrolase [Halobacteriota archaeon]